MPGLGLNIKSDEIVGETVEAGIRELLAAVPDVSLTFDPDNFMDSEHNRSWCGAAEVKRFYQENRDRLPMST